MTPSATSSSAARRSGPPWRAFELPRRHRGQERAARRRKKRSAEAARRPSEYSLLLTATLCLLAFGAVMVFSASSTTQVLADGGLGNSTFFLKRTLLFGILGLVAMRVLAVGGVRA